VAGRGRVHNKEEELGGFTGEIVSIKDKKGKVGGP